MTRTCVNRLLTRASWLKTLAFCLAAAAIAVADAPHPTLAIGSPAPDFNLPGVDGKMHRLSDYASAKILAVIFTCNHCPIAQLYEERIKQLTSDYQDKGVAVVAIQPNDPKAIRIDELDSADMSDSLAEMKVRAAWRHLNYPYLYDGETQSVANAYGPKATPHVFVFDQQRILRYEGRFDNSYRKELVKSQDARNAIDALLAGKPVPVAHTGVFGCSTKWKYKQQSSEAEDARLNAQPVSLETVDGAELKKPAAPNGNYLLLSFWSTQCASCLRELPALVDTERMYNDRDFSLLTVSTDAPDQKNNALAILQKVHASNRNWIIASSDAGVLEKSFDPAWQSGALTVLLSPAGKVLYRKQGDLDMLDLRRHILANLPAAYLGFQKYWIGP